MTSFTVKMMAGSPPPVTGSIGSSAKHPPATSKLPLQVKIKEQQKLETSEKKSTNISRRDLALFLTAASFSAVTLSTPKPAAARITKAEMKKMILEKLKLLREKVGLSKPEAEENEKVESPIEDKEVSPPATSAAEEKTSVPSAPEEKTPVPSEPPLPSIHNDKKIAVEAAIFP
ncbi:hypothetical protein HanXRQr2_Chr12g0549521 [Helianthus annuus]|uniref:Uncharacterized protein n=1 Tax=Helianthus annuus TaxID=4232 RepID=A0A251SA70_HELAN|nr:uncharacterized protein LOC110912011 [Helianthus annuus]KAF5778610.1 hypothetical protein HanXRQr2_Chr12g0549521 [Helianthus annuus]KAJ0489988.1 hypothetical protein HanHA300_Chr12g0450231 [Helianthus annuus]KAJ0494040.1 hypothetical protein HanIR_Chr12g0592891 [Helianthus annuus]KAJ0675575.1 hypothetical protein HanLR1_Chr12g0452711 [Helianthus annuus]KAJ0678852.1 hypothetical protein HanOQP8_Chr12g0452591 [Helianthus annuus]